MDMRTLSRDSVLEFIYGLRDNPCLWKCTSPEYKNKTIRLTAYNKLLEIVKKYEPNSTIADVKKKIQSIRASHRKERNKVNASLRTGSGSEEVYQPKLWYFKELEFLNDQTQTTASMSTLEIEDDNRSQQSTSTQPSVISEDNISSPPPSLNSLPDSIETPSRSVTSESEPPSFSRKRKADTTNQMFSLITHRLSQKEDEFDIFGKNVGSKLRTMTNTQKIFAQKLINDVIFYGQIEQLSIHSQVSVQPVSTNTPLLQGFNYSDNHLPRTSSSVQPVRTNTFAEHYNITNEQFSMPDSTTVNTRPSTSTSTATTPQFQGSDTQDQFNTGPSSDSLQYYVSNFSV